MPSSRPGTPNRRANERPRRDDPPSKSLTDLCEPFFEEVCAVIRSTAYGGESNAVQVRQRLLDLLDSIEEEAKEERGTVYEEYQMVMPVLAYFADDVINYSTLVFAPQWLDNRRLSMAPHINVVNGNAQFFTDLNGHLQGKASPDVLRIFQTCLSLGFCGSHRGEPERLAEYAETIDRRLESQSASSRLEDPLSPEALVVDDRILSPPVRERVVAIMVVLVALVLASVVVFVTTVYKARQDVGDHLGKVTNYKSK